MIRRATLLLLVGAIGIGIAAHTAGRPAVASNPQDEIQIVVIGEGVCLPFAGNPPLPCFDLWRPGSQQRLADLVTKGAPETPGRGSPPLDPPLIPDPRPCPVKPQPPSLATKLEGANPSQDRCRLLPSDFKALQVLSGTQLHANDSAIVGPAGPFSGFYVMAFLPDDDPVEFETTKGKFLPTRDAPTLDNSLASPRYVCDGRTGVPGDFGVFDDCNGDNVALKSMLVVPMAGFGADLGPGRITVSQGLKSAAFDFTVVGEPASVSIQAFKSTIANGIKDIESSDGTLGNIDGKLSGPDECPLPTSVAGFTAALGRPDKTVVIGRVKDAAGTDITQAWIHWGGTILDDVAHPTGIGPIGQFGAPITPTLDLGSFGFGAPQVLCGTKGTGVIKMTATLTHFAQTNNTVLTDPTVLDATTIHGNSPFPVNPAEMDINVVGQADTVVGTVDPVVVDCNGTNSAKVSATVLQADGQPVADGQSVRFDVVALGIANPIINKTSGGVATTTVTPLAPVDELRGTTVVISTIPSNDSAEVRTTSVLVDCTGSAVAGGAAGAGAAAGAAKPAPTGIRGPDTGSGPIGGGSALSWWPVLALAGGALALAGTRLATKRNS